MTRAEALAIIEQRVASTDDATLLAVAEILNAAGSTESMLPRDLTAAERCLIQQSKDDFNAGRTLTGPEARLSIDADLARLGVAKSAL